MKHWLPWLMWSKRITHNTAWLFVSVLSIGLLSLAAPARAQGNETIAEALFDEGRTLFEAQKYDKACAKFKESQRLDPATGTLLNLAMCYEKAGRLATAWTTWREAASSARTANQTDREEHAREMAKKIEGKLARLTLTVNGTDNLPQGFWVTQDGTAQPPAAWGVSLPIDGGIHHFEAGAPGFLTWRSDIQIKDGQTLTVSVPILALEGTPLPGSAPAAASEEAAKEQTDEEPTPEESGDDADEQAAPAQSGAKTGFKIAGIALTAGGAVSIAAGGIFGVRAFGLNEQSKNHCSSVDSNLCTLDGKEMRDKAINAATVSTILVGVGAAALTTGIVFLVVSKNRSAEVALSPTPFGGQFSIGGAF